ncbi:MAG: hypothetical protein NT034_01070 [Candidatus Magasanikbacteria bacterium]|nr:hypothetical protein [Candidatus Magasanikbacteria bacterium]
MSFTRTPTKKEVGCAALPLPSKFLSIVVEKNSPNNGEFFY